MTQGKGAQPYRVQKVTLVAADGKVQVREFTVAPGEEVPWHFHTEVTDWCYCLEGVISAETRDRSAADKITARFGSLTKAATGAARCSSYPIVMAW